MTARSESSDSDTSEAKTTEYESFTLSDGSEFELHPDDIGYDPIAHDSASLVEAEADLAARPAQLDAVTELIRDFDHAAAPPNRAGVLGGWAPCVGIRAINNFRVLIEPRENAWRHSRPEY